MTSPEVETTRHNLARWGKLIGASTIASVLIAIPSTLSTVLLLRLLSIDDAGQFGLVQAIVETLLVLAALGQPGLISRQYSQAQPGQYNWTRDLSLTLLISLPIILVGMVFVGTIYGFSPRVLGLLPGIIVLQVSLQLIGVISATQEKYVFGTVAQRLPLALLFVGSTSFLFGILPANFINTLWLWLAAVVVSNVVGLYYLQTHTKRGHATLSQTERVSGLIFLVSASVNVVTYQGVVAIGGIYLTSSLLAVFSAAAIIFRGYNLLDNVLRRIFITELARDSRTKILHLIILLWGGALAIGGLVILIMPVFIDVAYGGKYTESKALVPLLVVVGTLMLAETLPRSFVIGKSKTRVLHRFIWAQALVFVLCGSSTFLLIPRLGLVGLPLSQIVVLVGRNMVAYGMMLFELRQ